MGDATNISQVTLRRASDLSIHSLLRRMPLPDVDAPERIALRESIEMHGLDRQPLIINERDEVMDGRMRLEDARKLGLTEVPCIERRDAEAASIIVESLLARRHYTKGARAYVAAPLMEAAAKANVDVRTEHLRRGKSLRNTTEWSFGKTVDDFQTELGLGRELIRQAKELHATFRASDKRVRDWKEKQEKEGNDSDLAAALGPEDLRAKYEPQILAGDMGLGAVRQAIAGKLSTEGQPKVESPHAQLLFTGWDTAINRLGRWGKMEPHERDEFLAMVPRWVKSLPPELREIFAQELLAVS